MMEVSTEEESSEITTESVHHFYQIMSSSVDTIKNFCEKVPGFSELDKVDQEMLFQAAILELFTLRFAYRLVELDLNGFSNWDNWQLGTEWRQETTMKMTTRMMNLVSSSATDLPSWNLISKWSWDPSGSIRSNDCPNCWFTWRLICRHSHASQLYPSLQVGTLY